MYIYIHNIRERLETKLFQVTSPSQRCTRSPPRLIRSRTPTCNGVTTHPPACLSMCSYTVTLHIRKNTQNQSFSSHRPSNGKKIILYLVSKKCCTPSYTKFFKFLFSQEHPQKKLHKITNVEAWGARRKKEQRGKKTVFIAEFTFFAATQP